MNAGDKVYLACDLLTKERGPITTDVFEGSVVLDDGGDDIEITLNLPDGPQSLIVPRKNAFQTRDEAEKRLLAREIQRDREELRNLIGDRTNFYKKILQPLDGCHHTTHPLRASEPNCVFGAQSSVWGKEDNPQKALQIAGAIWEDIRALFAILFLLGHANDFAKKLMGKYIIIEMRSLYDCLERLRDLDARYKPLFGKGLQGALSRLDNEFGYPTIRNKIGAHRDGNLDIVESTQFWKRITRFNILKHLHVFARHLVELKALYPTEIAMYFNGLMPMPGLVETERDPAGDDDYEPFDPPWIVTDEPQSGSPT